MPKTPKRMGPDVHPQPGSRFLSQVLADNIHGRRALRRLSQDDLAERMRSIGHGKWTRATVTEIERERRSVTVDELLALALIFGVAIGELLDPTGIDGRGTEGLDYAIGEAAPMPALTARGWVRGVAVAALRYDDLGEVDYGPARLPDYKEGVRAAIDPPTWKVASRDEAPRARFAGLRPRRKHTTASKGARTT